MAGRWHVTGHGHDAGGVTDGKIGFGLDDSSGESLAADFTDDEAAQ